jgi:DNA mismatch repair protein MutS2
VNQHSLDLIEFPGVRQLVAERAASVRGRRLALDLHPSTDRARVEDDLAHLAQMLGLTIGGIDPGPIEVGEIGGLLSRLERTEEPLPAEDLIEIGRFLRVSTRARRTLDTEDVRSRAPAIFELGRRFGDFSSIVRRLDEVFDPSGEMLDSASPELASLRKRLRSTRVSAAETLAELARREASRPEETYVTLREGRYVLLVHGADRPRITGIVHGHSKTGQSVFLEPMQAIESNNAIASLEAREQEERLAILRALTIALRGRMEDLTASFEASWELDLLRARVRLALDLGGAIPRFALPEEEGVFRIRAARHPLLTETARLGGTPVVPLELELAPPHSTLVLSGPNMGGKTVALKTAGLICAMAQAGLAVPVGDGTILPFLDGIFADIGDEQSIEQETSTFAGHLRNIGLAWHEASARSLVLLDELGGGTDPDEGAALGRALLELLTERGCLVLATTHLVALKLLAHEHPKMANAAMEFDPETQRPTYRLRFGSPGRSRAFELAARLLAGGGLLERAEGYRSRWSAALDEILQDLEQKAAALEEEIRRTRSSRMEAENAIARRDREAQRLKERLASLREKRLETAGRAILEAERLLMEARQIQRESARLKSEGAGGGAAAPSTRELEGRLHAAAEKVRRPRGSARRPLREEGAQPGVFAFSEDLQSSVKIESQPDANQRVWILHGTIRFLVPVASLREPGEEDPRSPVAPRRARPVSRPQAESNVERQIDVRGKSAEEGLAEIERYVDRAAVAGVPEVRIIHGKGKGVLKREIEAFLSNSPIVESFRIGEPREGGWGATIVRVRSAQIED